MEESVGREGKESKTEREMEESVTRCEVEESVTNHRGSGSLLADIFEFFPGRRQDIRTYSPLTLAYIGDAVYDLIVRTVVVKEANRPVHELHRITVRYVSAPAQSKIVRELMGDLTEEELEVYRRGRNAKPHTMAKNASAADYKKATGFEAVIGYLYLKDRMERVLELVRKGIAVQDGGEEWRWHTKNTR